MATWTSIELATAVLVRLGITPSGQSADARHVVDVSKAWDSIYPQLRRLGLAPWGAEAIEPEYQEPLSKFVSGEVYGLFGLTGAREATILRDAATGWRQIQEQSSADKMTVPVRVKYY